MPVALRKLNELVGKDVLIVQLDGKAYKGKVTEIDDNVIAISNALEFSPSDKKWKVPQVAVPPESSVEGDVVKTDKMETIRMREIIVSFSSLLRIYPLSMKPSATDKPVVPPQLIKPPPVPTKSESGYVIRSVSTVNDKDKKKW